MPLPSTPSRPLARPAPFWDGLGEHGESLALLDPHSGRKLTYGALDRHVDEAAHRLARPSKRLVMISADRGVDEVVALLAVFRAGHAALLIDRSTPGPARARLMQAYRPDILVWNGPDASADAGWAAPQPLFGRMIQMDRCGPVAGALHDDLGLILSTSGSVGSPKAVRLSKANLTINAWQIADALKIRPGSRAVLSLPLAYTYGLSVLTSHLLAGGTLVVQDHAVLDPLFWRGCAAGAVETLPTVSFIVDFMAGPRWADLRPPSLKAVTHSGSSMSAKAEQWLGECASRDGLQTFRMYGMTEATARLSVLPAEEFPAQSKSVGRAVVGGAFEIDLRGQVIYRGPNVMMGYAETREGLASGDQLSGRLETGDTGRLDAEGRLILTGRLRRFTKILGLRLNLADMENYLSQSVETAIVSDDQRIVIYHASPSEASLDGLGSRFCAEFKLPPQIVTWRRLDRLPRTENGKILYGDLLC